jgi:Family of unknown function (DUF6152)
MKIRITIAALGVFSVLNAVPSWAHHSFAAEYDNNKPITLKGTVVSMEWVNPHSWLHIAVKGPDGKTVEWNCETAPPNGLYRQGWRKNSLKEGDEVTVEGFQAKDNSATMSARSVVTADGKRMFAGTAGDNGPGDKGPGEK